MNNDNDDVLFYPFSGVGHTIVVFITNVHQRAQLSIFRQHALNWLRESIFLADKWACMPCWIILCIGSCRNSVSITASQIFPNPSRKVNESDHCSNVPLSWFSRKCLRFLLLPLHLFFAVLWDNWYKFTQFYCPYGTRTCPWSSSQFSLSL